MVDTGLHSKGWSRERAVNFFVERNGSKRNEVEGEVDRYCSWPGQATGYKLGHSRIVDQRERARDLLMRVVEQDEENALAWLWLSGVVDGLDDREICLENVLSIEPDNTLAQKGLQVLRQQQVEQLVREGVAAGGFRPLDPLLAHWENVVAGKIDMDEFGGHATCESAFDPHATSPAGAAGLWLLVRTRLRPRKQEPESTETPAE